MTLGSDHTLAFSRTGFKRNCCIYRQQKARTDHFCCLTQQNPISLKYTNPPCLQNSLKFCLKNQPKMEQREPAGDHVTEGGEGSLKQLASKWFIETQVPLIVNNGLFPSWFLGFISRQQSEEILREKKLGSFLIRLSDKTIGYVLSYKGRDRCRHFVINQRQTGQFAVCGDTEVHNTMPELLEYYKTSPIEPFGEYLTSSCFEVLNEELYDIIQVSPKQKKMFALKAEKKVKKPQSDLAAETQLTRPAKNNRTQQEVPPLPLRTRHLDTSTISDQNGILYAQLRKQTPRDGNRSQQHSLDGLPHDNPRKSESSTSVDQSGSCLNPESVYSELSLLDTKSRSLPQLVSSSDREQSHRLTAPPQTPPRLSPKPIRQTQPGRTEGRPDRDCTSDTAIYHLVGRPDNRSPTPSHYRSATPEQDDDESVYAEVTSEAPDSTYEPLPGHPEPAQPEHNTYAPVEDKRRKQNGISWGLKNDKWKSFFTDGKKKQ